MFCVALCDDVIHYSYYYSDRRLYVFTRYGDDVMILLDEKIDATETFLVCDF